MKKFLISILIFFSFQFIYAGSVDTAVIYSNSMQKNIKCIIIKPSSYKKKKLRFPTVYLLHGYSGWYSNWIIRDPELKNYADEFQVLIVCPEGATNSWYFDSPVNDKMRYETHVSSEVPHYIDSAYRTIADKNHRAITGLSMGGHGALFLAWRHTSTFAAAGSMSGALDLWSLTGKFDLFNILGDTLNQGGKWNNYSVINLAETKPADSLAIIIDCGIGDTFIETNRRVHQKLLSNKIPHEYIERPGKHEWPYWRFAVHFQLLFFKKFFQSHPS